MLYEVITFEYKDISEIFEYMLAKARKNNYFASLIYEEHIKYMKGRITSYNVCYTKLLRCPCIQKQAARPFCLQSH